MILIDFDLKTDFDSGFGSGSVLIVKKVVAMIFDLFLHFFVIWTVHAVAVVVIHTDDHDSSFVVVVAVGIVIECSAVTIEMVSILLRIEVGKKERKKINSIEKDR